MKYIIAFTMLFSSGIMLAQNVWKAVDESQIVTKSGADREIIPTKYGTFSLDFKKMQKALFCLRMAAAAAALVQEITMLQKYCKKQMLLHYLWIC